MSNKGDKLKQRLAEFVSTQSEEPSKKELEAALKIVFNEKKKQGKAEKDKSNVEKPKRKPTLYNIFYAEQSAILKQKESEEDEVEKMTAKAKMLYIASLWKSKNGKDADIDTEPELDEDE
jgi:hypothetical protein